MRYLLAFLVIGALSGSLQAQSDIEKALQTQMILAKPGDTIYIPEGKHYLSNTLWLDGKQDVAIIGVGAERCVLSFAKQTQGAEGIKVTNSQRITLARFTVEDSKGDLIKTQACDDLLFANLTARWNGKPKSSNGGYALYPVQCQRVRIERCTAIGASDAGIYVGQSDSVWVTRCYAKHNVAGIEIENTTNAWVWNNITAYNTGGILVFDLPDLPKKAGGNVAVWNNKVVANNHRNFAPKGNIVGKVPPGTGIMVLATQGVEIAGNSVFDNRTASTAVVSYYITENPLNDKDYKPCPQQVYIHDNVYSEGKRRPTLRNRLGMLLRFKFGRKLPHIIYDGIACEQSGGNSAPALCLGANTNGTFANLRADNKFKNISRDTQPYRCELPSLIPSDNYE
ncbi:MAG: parallel beta-helix domain-containing protein [Saprospiraceae bacterium]